MAGRHEPVNEHQIEARHRVAHDLASPIRGAVIISDLLAEALESATPDTELLRELSAQLTAITTETAGRLAAFAHELDG